MMRMMREIMATQCTSRALTALIAGSTNSIGG
jgi:hypothetical protein